MNDRISTLASYDFFKERHPDIKMPRKLYNKIIKAINQKAFEKMLTTGQKYVEPYGLGRKQIVKIKAKANNKVLTHKLDKPVKYSNFHTDGYLAKTMWSHKAIFRNVNIWGFNLNRMLKRPNNNHKRELNMRDYIMENGLDHLLEYTP